MECHKICQKGVVWWYSLEESNLSRRLSKIDLIEDSKNNVLWGPARTIAISNSGNDIKHLNLDSFSDAFCTNTYLPPDGVTHRNFYTEQLSRAGILTQRGLCTEKLLCTDTFTH